MLNTIFQSIITVSSDNHFNSLRGRRLKGKAREKRKGGALLAFPSRPKPWPLPFLFKPLSRRLPFQRLLLYHEPPLEINRRDEARWYTILPSQLHQSHAIVLILYFQTLSCNKLSVLSSFFFCQRLKKVCFSNRNIGQICLNIYFCFILCSLQCSSPCRGIFAVLYL